MGLLRLISLPSDGWRKTAVINTSIVGFFAVINFSTLIWSLTKSSLSGNNVFSKGECGKISLLNTFLHLLLNIAASLIIASSNFFMQVLTSPTRAEVDRAHARKRWLEIGVPSLRNVLNVSPYKSLAWALFGLSSVPIHLLFNSSIFTVDYSGSQWQMAVVSESILSGGQYSVPGAALTLNGTHCADPPPMRVPGSFRGYDFGNDNSDVYDLSRNMTTAMATVMATATQNLSVSECKSEYQTCRGLRKYRNLLLVIRTGDELIEPQGWVVNNIYNMTETVGSVYDLSALEQLRGNTSSLEEETFSSVWKHYFDEYSMSQPNSLWFNSACYKGAATHGFPLPSDGCYNSCTGPLGLTWSKDSPEIKDTEVKSSEWEFSWIRTEPSLSTLRPRSAWTVIMDQADRQDLIYSPNEWPSKCIGIPRPRYLDSSTNNIHVQYCLAEPFEPGCKVAISNMLLLVVTLCIFIKFILCMGVVFALRDDPLVTPGDAAASFLSVPDRTTIGTCAATISDICLRISDKKPLQWQTRSGPLAKAISPAYWVINYSFFLVLLIILGVSMRLAFYAYPPSAVSSLRSILSHEQSLLNGGVFAAEWFPTGDFLASVLLPNTPQLILSCAYFAYNSLYTRFLAELEWQSFSMEFSPLRVTNPRGDQRSTFRLQLPYRYSIPLLVVSIFLHWITSNAIFTFMSEGGYYNELPDDGIQKNAEQVVLVGFSSPAILIGFCVSLLLVLLPLAFGLRRLPGYMIISRSNSLIISAACHVSTVRKVHSTYSRSTSEALDDNTFNENTDPLGNVDERGDRSISAISQTVEESIELQPLIAESFEHSAAPTCSTIQSEQTKPRVLAGNISNIEASVYPEHSQISNKLAKERHIPSLPECHDNSNLEHLEQDNRTALDDDRDTEERPFLSSWPSRASIINNSSIFRRDRNAAYDNSNTYSGWLTVTELDAGTEPHRVISSATANSDDTVDRLEGPRELEDISISEENDTQFRIRLSRSRIRWGVVRMPEEFYTQFGTQEIGVILGHLTFGIEDQGVDAPEEHPGYIYA